MIRIHKECFDLKNLKIGIKIALGFGVVCLLMVVIVLSVFVSGTNTTKSVTNIDKMSEYVSSVNAVKASFYNVRIYANILLN